MDIGRTALISTIKERCRVCYTCVRECPAKAIRIAGGQAEVLPQRCIACGNCVQVCSQEAKRVHSELELVEELLRGPDPVAAIVAPSFPAEFGETEYVYLVGMIRELGFRFVHEVGFGADLVASAYRKLLATSTDRQYIATTCPAIVGYVERYHPELVPALAPIVSPMIATARALRRLHGDGLRIVFIGPCIAKKAEADARHVANEVDAVITFIELRQLLGRRALRPESAVPSDFDPPHAGTGALFPITRGMLQAAQIEEDLIKSEVFSADGSHEFGLALKEFAAGTLRARLLEVLCCNGCIMGPGVSQHYPLFKRRAMVSQYVRQRTQNIDSERWHDYWARLADLDLTRKFAAHDMREDAPTEEQIAEVLLRMGKREPMDELNCGACGYATCREHATAILKGLAESEMCLPYAIEQLKQTNRDLAVTNEQLASAQEALMHAEKLASMGQLAAGIAHEVNNPLGTVLMLAHTLLEETPTESPAREDLALMASEADRCKKIVSGLLQFARKNKVEARATDVRALVDGVARSLRLPPGVRMDIEHADGDPDAEIDRDQVAQVLTNLVNNALDAMPRGGRLTLRTRGDAERVQIEVADTGTGIPPELHKRIFEPFFTTKPPGKGTGLGLSVTYGIVKMHHGDLRVESNADPAKGPTGTTFTVTLPRRRMRAE